MLEIGSKTCTEALAKVRSDLKAGVCAGMGVLVTLLAVIYHPNSHVCQYATYLDEIQKFVPFVMQSLVFFCLNCTNNGS